MRVLPILLVFTLALTFCSQKKTSESQNTEATIKVSLSQEDLTEINLFTDSLLGVELFFMKLSEGNSEESAAKYSLLIQNKGQKVSGSIQSFLEAQQFDPFPYSIALLNKENDYLHLKCNTCKKSKYMTYWDVSDGTQLVATVDRDCSPLCSDELKFYTYSEGQLDEVKVSTIMEPLKIESFFKDPEGHAVEELQEFPVEMAYQLPKEGKNILVTLKGGTSPATFKGTQLELIWNDGKFERGEFK